MQIKYLSTNSASFLYKKVVTLIKSDNSFIIFYPNKYFEILILLAINKTNSGAKTPSNKPMSIWM